MQAESNYSFEDLDCNHGFGLRTRLVVGIDEGQPERTVAIRIRAGQEGYSEWINELQVYLLPKFKHKNILPFYGSERLDLNDGKRSSKADTKNCSLIDSFGRFSERQKLANPSNQRKSSLLTTEYWIMNKFHNCQTLRDYLKRNTLNWSQMLNIAKGIMIGLNFLHENVEYQKFDTIKDMERCLWETNKTSKKVSFVDQICMKPHLFLSVIHRNLSSQNIVLAGDLTPQIWNFGSARIYHPFRPTNHYDYISSEAKKMHLASQYSPPEVLSERGHLSLPSMKSLDFYACGIIYWELISRCVLPDLSPSNEEELKERREPERYYEPFEKEFGRLPSPGMLQYAICKLRARPRIKQSWMIGRKTFRFVQTIQELWDSDWDARLHSTTVIDRLNRLSVSNRDSRHNYGSERASTYGRHQKWPPIWEHTQAIPFSVNKWGEILKLDNFVYVEEMSTFDFKLPHDSSSSSNYEEDNTEDGMTSVINISLDLPTNTDKKKKTEQLPRVHPKRIAQPIPLGSHSDSSSSPDEQTSAALEAAAFPAKEAVRFRLIKKRPSTRGARRRSRPELSRDEHSF